ncbi:MAG TPA: DinB family protein [Tepidisphaeraceae bacterium]|nr:DinB family protein [Tepidisphaeraceae bacterium]
MKNNEMAAEQLQGNLGVVKMTLADFTDADMLTRPCPGANHTAWQLGHLISAETRLINGEMPGAMPELPAGFAEKFNKSTAAIDDPAAFPKKADLLALFEKTRNASIQWAKGLTDEDLNRPVQGPYKTIAPTIHHLAALIPSHTTMHMGQMQVIRRKLGKPVLF